MSILNIYDEVTLYVRSVDYLKSDVICCFSYRFINRRFVKLAYYKEFSTKRTTFIRSNVYTDERYANSKLYPFLKYNSNIVCYTEQALPPKNIRYIHYKVNASSILTSIPVSSLFEYRSEKNVYLCNDDISQRNIIYAYEKYNEKTCFFNVNNIYSFYSNNVNSSVTKSNEINLIVISNVDYAKRFVEFRYVTTTERKVIINISQIMAFFSSQVNEPITGNNSEIKLYLGVTMPFNNRIIYLNAEQVTERNVVFIRKYINERDIYLVASNIYYLHNTILMQAHLYMSNRVVSYKSYIIYDERNIRYNSTIDTLPIKKKILNLTYSFMPNSLNDYDYIFKIYVDSIVEYYFTIDEAKNIYLDNAFVIKGKATKDTLTNKFGQVKNKKNITGSLVGINNGVVYTQNEEKYEKIENVCSFKIIIGGMSYNDRVVKTKYFSSDTRNTFYYRYFINDRNILLTYVVNDTRDVFYYKFIPSERNILMAYTNYNTKILYFNYIVNDERNITYKKYLINERNIVLEV